MPDELVGQWVEKAEEDWIGISRLRVGGLAQVADPVAFLAQQCAEKYLKALIQQESAEPPRLHHLSALLDILLFAHPDLEGLRVACERLTPYAVGFRYPGEKATGEEAEEAVDLSRQVRAAVRLKLGLVDDPSANGV
ncbi:HEPN domain-containing protein [bacterium]|nr:HEPN domain-containing protein [bacterium]